MPQPRRIDRSAIVAVATDLLDERGLDGVSLHAIADRLGVQQPALYHHVDSKAALLAAVAADILDRRHTDRLPRPDETWDRFVMRNARSLRRALLSVRDGARLITSTGARAPRLENAIAQVDLLERHGFDGEEAVMALIAISRYVIGAVLEEQATRDRDAFLEAPDPADPRASHLLDLTRRVSSLGADAEFEVGLIALVRGLDPAG